MIPTNNSLVKNDKGVYVVDQTENELKKILDDPKTEVFMDMSRRTMGMDVDVVLTKDESFLLSARTNAAHKVAEIPVDKIVHAFYHPCLYVANPSELFPKSKSL